MKKTKYFNHYNPEIHRGCLPIRVLDRNLLHELHTFDPGLLEEIKYECEQHGLNKLIKMNIDREPIEEIALINHEKQIELFQNYNQFLWSLCYSLIVLFDEGLQKPMLKGKYTGYLDTRNPLVKKAIDVFRAGMSLFTNFSIDIFYNLPNPEKYTIKDKFYIEKANGAYISAMNFILIHEIGHQYYGHLNAVISNNPKKYELDADDYAFKKFANHFRSQKRTTIRLAIITAMSSLIFTDNTLKGGITHPDPDDRLKTLIEQMHLSPKNHLWGIASLAYRLWMIHYNISIKLPKDLSTFKKLFYVIMDKLIDYKTSS